MDDSVSVVPLLVVVLLEVVLSRVNGEVGNDWLILSKKIGFMSSKGLTASSNCL